MSKVQRLVLIGGLLACFLAGLFPPVAKVLVLEGDNYYGSAGRTFLFVPWLTYDWWRELSYRRIDYYRLCLEWLTIAAATGAAFLFAHRWKGRSATGQ